MCTGKKGDSHQLDALDPARPRADEVLVLEFEHERHGEAVVVSLPTSPSACAPPGQRAAGHWAGIATLGKLHSCQGKEGKPGASGLAVSTRRPVLSSQASAALPPAPLR